MDVQLNEALDAARDFVDMFDGGASVAVVFNPYEGHWDAYADWSDSTRITVSNYYPSIVIPLLTEKLKTVLAGIKSGQIDKNSLKSRKNK